MFTAIITPYDDGNILEAEFYSIMSDRSQMRGLLVDRDMPTSQARWRQVVRLVRVVAPDEERIPPFPHHPVDDELAGAWTQDVGGRLERLWMMLPKNIQYACLARVPSINFLA